MYVCRSVFNTFLLSPSSQPNYSTQEIMKWIKLDKEEERVKIRVCLRALELFSSMGDAVNLVGVIGPIRMGKSALLNWLLSKKYFITQPGGDSCTSGLDLCPVPVVVRDWVPVDPDLSAPTDAVRKAMVSDLEGMGDQRGDYDDLLAGLCLVMFKVVVLNWKGYPGKTGEQWIPFHWPCFSLTLVCVAF